MGQVDAEKARARFMEMRMQVSTVMVRYDVSDDGGGSVANEKHEYYHDETEVLDTMDNSTAIICWDWKLTFCIF